MEWSGGASSSPISAIGTGPGRCGRPRWEDDERLAAEQPDIHRATPPGRHPITLSSTVVLSVVALGVLSTGIAYVLNYRLIQDEGPTAASMTNYLTPIVAVLLGIALVDERLTWNLIIGAAMILVGLWIAEHDPNERQALSDTLMSSKDQG